MTSLPEGDGHHSGLAGLYRPTHLIQSELTLLSHDQVWRSSQGTPNLERFTLKEKMSDQISYWQKYRK